MPIRSSISDPYGQGTKEINRLLRDGPLPSAPDKKPPASEREPLLATLQAMPIGKNMSRDTWIHKYAHPNISRFFVLWGIRLSVQPMSRTEYDESKTCTGVFIQGVTRTRRGIQPMMNIKGPYSKSWYRQILDFIEDNYYGG